MGQRRIVWSNHARNALFRILEFYTTRNGSKTYSKRLYHKINSELEILRKHPNIGVNTEMQNIKGLIVDDYIVFYEYDKKTIIVHTVWYSRQNPDKMSI